MRQNLVSTQEVAAMFHVAETTIKRWADEAILPCIRTAGRHRKFYLKDVLKFAQTNGYSIGGARAPEMSKDMLEELEVGVHTANHRKVAQVFREQALQADGDTLLSLLLYLHKQQIPYPVIVDEIIRPAFEVIGQRWKDGTLEVNQEHAAAQATMEALIRMSSDLHRKDANGLSVVCACPEGELHEIGLRALAYGLECEGWKVHFIGANTPFDTLATFIGSMRPSLVCLSITTLQNRRNMLENMQKLASLVHAYGGKLVVGGDTLSAVGDIPADHVAESIQDTIAYTRDVFQLKPGPKKKSTSKNN